MKNQIWFVTALASALSASAFADTQTSRHNDTSNQGNVAELKKLLLAEGEVKGSYKVEGRTPGGEECTIQVSASAFGIAVNVWDSHQRVLGFYASRSGKTSEHFSLDLDEGRIEATEVLRSMDERDNDATIEDMVLNYVEGGNPARIDSVEISNNQNTDWKTVGTGANKHEIPVFKDENKTSITCSVNNR